MAQSMTLLSFLCSFLSSLLLLISPVAAGRRNGLTVQLIHRDSPASPVFNPAANLTSLQKLQTLVHQSKTRINYVLSRPIHPQMIRPAIDLTQMVTYIVHVGIGTFAADSKEYYLHMDTGCELTWTQCEGCLSPGHQCFPQKQPLFPNSNSESYNPLPCNQSPLCLRNQCIGDLCSINMSYMDGSSIIAILANETFTFDSGTGTPETVPELAFGCTIDSRDMAHDGGDENLVTGIFGLGWGPRSFLTQIDSVTEGRFSYCLKPDDGRDLNTYLRFGADIPAVPGLQTTTLLHLKDWQAYYISLLGISVNGARLNIDPTQFVLRSNRSGGCIIDSGCSVTHLIRPAFNALVSNLEEHFSGSSNLNRSDVAQGVFDLCYLGMVPEGYNSFPNMTFHLRNNADLEIGPRQMFYVGKLENGMEYFCLAILGDDDITSLGAYQQANQRFIYDVKLNQLRFGPEDCALNA